MRSTARVASRRRRKRILEEVKGQVGGRNRLIRTASEAVLRGRNYAYVGRKQKKRLYRSLWITRINAAVRQHGMRYSQFMQGLQKSGITLDRKQLSELAIHDAAAFTKVVDQVKAALTR